MKIKCPNIILFDTNDTISDFKTGVENGSKMEWQAIVSIGNKSRKKKINNIIRYIKYFVVPFKAFLKRKKIKNLIGWQAFYAFTFAFYCSFFHVRKTTFVVVKNFIYKPKKGIKGKLYLWYINKTLKSKYIDKIIVSSPEYGKYCSKLFNISEDRFVPFKFSVKDFSLEKIDEYKERDYVLSIGRSNRDWSFLVNSYANSKYKVLIICDQFDKKIILPPNMKLLDNVTSDESLKYIKNCKLIMIPILDSNVASGDTVLGISMCFGKPAIVTSPSTLSEYYIDDGLTGYSIPKDSKILLSRTEELYCNESLYEQMCILSRQKYEKELSLLEYGNNVGKLFIL